MLRARRWTITKKAETEDDRLKYDAECMRFIIYQLEKAPTTGYMHLQGYVEFKQPMRQNAVKRLFGDTAHLEVAKGSAEQNIAYCSKEETRLAGPWEEGVRVHAQGARTDLLDIKSRLDDGAGMEDIAADYFSQFIRYYRGLEKYAQLKSKSRSNAPHVIVLWGSTGTGKSRWANERDANAFWFPGSGDAKQPWFDGYTGQRTAIIDDFRDSLFSLPMLLRILDRYPLRVPVKGAFVQWTPEEIILTTNQKPTSWYGGGIMINGDECDMPAPLRRRIDHIVHVKANETIFLGTCDKCKELHDKELEQLRSLLEDE